MNAIGLLIVAATLGVEPGYQPDPADPAGVEFIIQLKADEVELLLTNDVTSSVPSNLKVTSFRIRVGEDALPREAPPAAAPAKEPRSIGEEAKASPATTDREVREAGMQQLPAEQGGPRLAPAQSPPSAGDEVRVPQGQNSLDERASPLDAAAANKEGWHEVKEPLPRSGTQSGSEPFVSKNAAARESELNAPEPDERLIHSPSQSINSSRPHNLAQGGASGQGSRRSNSLQDDTSSTFFNESARPQINDSARGSQIEPDRARRKVAARQSLPDDLEETDQRYREANDFGPARITSSKAALNASDRLEKKTNDNVYLTVLFFLLLSIGANFYLGWLAWGYYMRYKTLLSKFRSEVAAV